MVANEDKLLGVYNVTIRSYMMGIDPYNGTHDSVFTINVKQCQIVSLSLTSFKAPSSPLSLTILEGGTIYQYIYVVD